MSSPVPEPERILCVDDEVDILAVVRSCLELGGYSVDTSDSADAAIAGIRTRGLPDLAVVDLLMPVHDGFWLCRELKSFCDLPIVLLTAVDDEPTTVRAIEEVAEDYIVKPFRPPELLARVRRVLKRMGSTTLSSGRWNRIDSGVEVDFPRKRLRIEGVEKEITPIESKILHVLWRNLGRVVRTGYLLRRVWPTEEVFEDALRVHVHRLRRKMEADPANPTRLTTERGQGYRLASKS